MIHLFQPDKHLRGHIRLERSKSLSNRALIIRELCAEPFPIDNLSGSSDTRTLEYLLFQVRNQQKGVSKPSILDAGAGGTTFRFLTAFLSFQPGVQLLTGSDRMKERPVGPLVMALRQLGARISYGGRPGFPPLLIEQPDWDNYRPGIRISASISSQFISALMLVAPMLPEGLHLHLEDTVVSRPYIDMTLAMMRNFGVESQFSEREIAVPPGSYKSRPFSVEPDWSAASYFYSFAALSDTCDLYLEGLQKNSLQGDAIIASKMAGFGVKTTFDAGGARLTRTGVTPGPLLEWDFLGNPDLAPTIFVLCAAMGVQGLFSGLETLQIKETDRLVALRKELAKVGVAFGPLPTRMARRPNKSFFVQEGRAHWSDPPQFKTWGDHRMAMAFSALGFLGPIRIEDPAVVDKSYPMFWKDLQSLGFVVDQGF